MPYEDSLASLERNAPLLTVVSPAYFRLNVVGLSAALEEWDPGVPFPRARIDRLVEKGSLARASVLPLVGCIGPCGPKISRLLDDKEGREAHVRSLVHAAKAQNLSGLFIDYEDVDAKESSVTSFVTELAAALHTEGKKLGLVVQEPCGAAPTCKRAPYPFALDTLVLHVDLLAVMEYDYAVDGSSPPAPAAWVKRGLEHLARAIPSPEHRKKTLCAVPLYGRATAGLFEDTAFLHRDYVARRLGQTPFVIDEEHEDAEALSKVATVSAGQKKGKLYIEDATSLAKRLSLTSEWGLGGVALWRLGGEDPQTAQVLDRYLHPPRGAAIQAKTLAGEE